jgi:hypothetical protein
MVERYRPPAQEAVMPGCRFAWPPASASEGPKRMECPLDGSKARVAS